MKVKKDRPYKAHELGLDDPEGLCWGVFVGACVDERTAWTVWEGAAAHAHNTEKQSSHWFGWICVLDPKTVLTRSGYPSMTLLHEFAHILVPNAGHTVRWKQEVTRLGAGSEILRCKLKPL